MLGVLADFTLMMCIAEDTGTGFSLKEIEANPSGFFADVHTATYVAGAVRGQLEKKDW